MVSVCPVCEGRGFVPANFYTGESSGTDCETTTCRSCRGRGYVTDCGVTPLPYYPPPYCSGATLPPPWSVEWYCRQGGGAQQ